MSITTLYPEKPASWIRRDAFTSSYAAFQVARRICSRGFEGRPGVSAMTLRTLRPVDWRAKRPTQKGGGTGC